MHDGPLRHDLSRIQNIRGRVAAEPDQYDVASLLVTNFPAILYVPPRLTGVRLTQRVKRAFLLLYVVFNAALFNHVGDWAYYIPLSVSHGPGDLIFRFLGRPRQSVPEHNLDGGNVYSGQNMIPQIFVTVVVHS